MMKSIKAIAKFHEEYDKHILNKKRSRKEACLDDPEKALFFIFSFSFYQGRRDEISEVFQKRAEEECKSYFKKNNSIFTEKRERILEKHKLKTEYPELEMALKEGGVNKEGDRLMVISFLNYIQSNEEKNIVRHIINNIKNKKLREIYTEIDSLWSVGPKITALILRDIVCIYELESCVENEEYRYLQPIDTWVHKLAKKIKMIDPKTNSIYPEEPADIAQKCIDAEISPIHFNQGAWYVGVRSFDILLDNLENIL